MHSGIFTISLDFELHWGNFDKWRAEDFRQYFLNTRQQTIPEMLALFARHDVGVTWATVGALLHHDRQEFEKNLPSVWPAYEKQEFGMQHYLQQFGVGRNEEEDIYHFAPSLVKQVIQTPKQELATHTFAHYYCNEPGQSIEAFEADLQSAVRVQQQNWGSSPLSIVFPRNQFSAAHVAACAKAGITSIRSNPDVWWWEVTNRGAETRRLRFMRGADAYLKLGGPFSYALNTVQKLEGVWALPASRLLRAHHPRFRVLETMRVKRVLEEMTYAAQKREVYHLWWHPHNFGWYPTENLAALQVILEHYSHLKNRFGMQSLTMAATTDLLNELYS